LLHFETHPKTVQLQASPLVWHFARARPCLDSEQQQLQWLFSLGELGQDMRYAMLCPMGKQWIAFWTNHFGQPGLAMPPPWDVGHGLNRSNPSALMSAVWKGLRCQDETQMFQRQELSKSSRFYSG
jgi:hypothetical protein